METSQTNGITGHSLIGIMCSADLETAARLMSKHDIGALGVYDTDCKRLLGIVTERDLTRSIAERRDPSTTRVDEVMTAPVIKAFAPISDEEARRFMQRAHIRHLVVADAGAHRVLSLRDV